MLSFPPVGLTRIFVARDPVDMRKGFDGLTGVVIETVDEDPQSGHLFLFFNRSRNRVKLLVWDGSGLLAAVQAARAWSLPDLRSNGWDYQLLRALGEQSLRCCSMELTCADRDEDERTMRSVQALDRHERALLTL